MALSSVFGKTAKGVDEVSTRAHRLPARVRAMLIMIDGQRSEEQLLAMSHSAADGRKYLGQLLAGGFVRPLSSAVTEASAAARTDEDIRLAKSYVIRTVPELLGAQADPLLREIEAAETLAELRQHVDQLRLALASAADQKKAAQFLEKVALALD